MSSRLLRRLREEKEKQEQQEKLGNLDENSGGDDDGSSDSDEAIRSKDLFGMLVEEEEEEEEYEFENENDASDKITNDNDDDDEIECGGSTEHNFIEDEEYAKSTNKKWNKLEKSAKVDDEEENLDAILSEFSIISKKEERLKSEKSTKTIHSILLGNLNSRHFNLDSTLQSVMEGSLATTKKIKNKNRQFLFGGGELLVHNNRVIRPSHLNGGGMGMEKKQDFDEDSIIAKLYRDSSIDFGIIEWCKFIYSDVYERLEEQYETLQATGDVNLLALFIADNPFHTRSLLQLSTVFYKTGSADKGKELLQRCLFVYQCAAVYNFFPGSNDRNAVLMDFSWKENQGFFLALFRYMQCASMVGCIPTSLAIAKLLLSLDPLFDPMGVLLILDFYVLAINSLECNKFIIELVEYNLPIYYLDKKDSNLSSLQKCDLLSMPNWAYSYSLSLHRYNVSNDTLSTSENHNTALQVAICTYPSIVSRLLLKNKIDINSRTTNLFDWGGVLPKLNSYFEKEEEKRIETIPVLEKIIDIFIAKNASLWSSQDVLLWLYETCVQVVSKKEKEEKDFQNSQSEYPLEATEDTTITITALNRYKSCDVSDYTDQVTTLPAELNLLDERLVAPALAFDPNRRRLLPQHVGAHGMQQDGQWMWNNHQQEHYNRIDLDDPMLEVFLRSLLPWNSAQR